jgi:prepilin-type N-terminal cleavage/methylation domain-containing protein
VKLRSVGFSLIELLTAIAVIGILTLLSLPALTRARDQADRTRASSNLRQIGIALHAYATDNRGLLPGPMWPGQIPTLDPNREGRLVRSLQPYLGIPRNDTPVLVDLLIPPAFRRAVPESALAESRTYVLNMAVRVDGSPALDPWGNLAGPQPPPTSIAIGSVPAQSWALSDADQLHPRVRNAAWRANTPPSPIHGSRRQALLFSGTVALLDEATLQ